MHFVASSNIQGWPKGRGRDIRCVFSRDKRCVSADWQPGKCDAVSVQSPPVSVSLCRVLRCAIRGNNLRPGKGSLPPGPVPDTSLLC